MLWHVRCFGFHRKDGRVEEDFNVEEDFKGRRQSVAFFCSFAMSLWFEEFRGSGTIASVI